MSGVRLLALGVGDAFSAVYYSACMALEAEGVWLLIDCPHPIRKILRESSAPSGLSLDVHHILATVITHLHADHSSGLEGLGFFSHFRLERKAQLAMHPEVAARLWEGHLAAGMEGSMPVPGQTSVPRTLADFFHITSLSESEAVQIGPFRIQCRRTRHSIPTMALRIWAGGRCLGYSADTGYDPALIDWLSPSDLIVHETNLGIHTPYEKLAALPTDLKSRMRLIHYLDAFDGEASEIEPLRQGRCYEV